MEFGNGIYLSSPVTEHWVGWLMLLLLLCLGLAILFQPGRYIRAFRSLPTTKERDSIFVGSGSDNRSRVTLTIYGIVVISLLLRWLQGSEEFGIMGLLPVAGCVMAAVLARWVMQRLVAFTFFQKAELEVLERHYHYLMDCTTLLLYPILLMALYGSVSRSAIVVLLVVLLVCYFGILTYKLLACLPLQLSALLWVPLYLLTVEAIPLAGMVAVSGKL